MAWFVLARVLFLAAVTGAAVFLQPLNAQPILNAGFGLLLGAIVIAFEWRVRDLSVTHMLGALIGGAIGLALARMLVAALFWTNTAEPGVAFLHALLVLALTYLGVLIGGRKGEWLEPSRLVTLFRAAGPQRRYKILDTSVIIDGRIADICETGFLDGTLVIPQFVLKELQLVADSPDSLKRNRGRRGLDILQKIQKMEGVEVTISDVDFTDVK
jgi:uncharacterized protein YacL